MENLFTFLIIDTVITIAVIALILVLFVKKIISGVFSRILLGLKNNPELFKQHIEGSDSTKKHIIQTIQSFEKIKKMKLQKSLNPNSRIMDIFVKTKDGQDQQFRANFIIKEKTPKLTELTRYM